MVTVYPGARAADIADKVTRVLEKELNTLPGLARVTSTSRDEVSSIRAEFDYAKGIGEALLDVQNAVARVSGALPVAVREPRIDRLTDATRPLLTLALTPKPESLKRLSDIRLLADNDIKDRLLTVPGVGDVQVFGGHQPQVEVRVDRDALAARGLTLGQTMQRLAEQNVSAPAGTVYGSRREYLVQVAGEFDSARALESLPVAATAQSQVLLGDVAEVRLAEADPRSLYHGNGLPAIAVNVLRPDGGETVGAIRSLKSALPALERAYPDIAFAITDDQQPIIDLNVTGMRSSLWQAVLLTVVVIMLFLADLRAAAAISVSIPLSFLAALTVLWFSPYTLNMVTLSGLIIAVGMVVDASIVVIENIYRHYAAGELDPLGAARRGTDEVALAITAGMLTTVVVLVPVMFTRGFTGRIMTPLNLMIISTLVASLLVALTVIPLVAGKLLSRPRRGPNRLERALAPLGRGVDRVAERYIGLVRLALRHRLVFLVLTLVFLVFTLRVVKPLLGGEEMPPMDTGIALIDFDTNSGATPAEVEATLTRVEQMVYREPAVQSVSAVVGSEPGAVSFGSGGATTQSGRLTIHLTPRTERTRSIWEIEQGWREALRQIPGVRTSRVSEYGATPVSTTKAPLDVILSGPDPAVLDRLGDQVIARLRGTPGLIDLRRSWYRDKPAQAVTVDPPLARLYGTSPAEVAANLRTAVQGTQATSLSLSGFLDIPVRVRYRADQMAAPENLAEVTIPTRLGMVPLSALAKVTPLREAPFVTRDELQTTLDVTAGNSALTIAQATAKAKQRLHDLPLPAGYRLQVAGSARDMADGQKEMGRALVLGLVLLYILLLAMFKSPWHPLTIMTAIPLAVAGAFWGLLVFDKPFCKPAFMGLILLGGTIVNNAILMLDFIHEARKQGLPVEEAIVQAVRLRLRPILMTAASTIVGFSPIIFEMAVGLERMSPLGIAAGSGLLFGTVVTTVVTPVIFSLLESLRLQLAKLLIKTKAPATPLVVLAVAGGLLIAVPGRAQQSLPEPLTLEAAVEYALTHNPDLQAARAEVERLGGATLAAQSPGELRIDLLAAGSWNGERHTMIPGVSGSAQRSDHLLYQAGAAARLLVTDFGKTRAEVRAARELESAGARDEARRRQETVFEVSRLFLTTLAAHDLLEPARASKDSLAAILASTEKLVRAGRAARVDGLKAKVQLARVKSRIAELEARKRSLRAALAATLGLEGPLPPLAYAAARPIPEPESGATLQQQVDERPDVAARRAVAAAAEEEVVAARRDFLPRLDLVAAYTWFGADDPVPVNSGGEDESWEDDATVGLQISFPLLDGGLRRAILRQAEARGSASRAALKKQRLLALSEAETAAAELSSALARARANRTAVEEGREALRVEKLKYESGKGVINDVLDAEAALLEAEGLLRESRRQAEVARLALDLALGRLGAAVD